MKRIGIWIALCLLWLTACAAPTTPGGIPVCPNLQDTVAAETTETSVSDEAYALVDWMIFVRYNGRSYTRDFSEPTVIPKDQIGAQLGTVESKPPSPTPVDYVTNVPDGTSFGYRIGAPFYEIKEVNPAYEIAVYDSESGEYHALCYGDVLPNKTQIVRQGLPDDDNYSAVRLFENYSDFSAAYREQFPDYDEAFFRDNVLAVIYLEEGSGSISHEVTMVRRVGETIEIHIRREIPEVGTCDMAYWAITAAISREDWDGAEIVPVINTHQLWSEEWRPES